MYSTITCTSSFYGIQLIMCVPIVDPECGVRMYILYKYLFMYPCCTMVYFAKSPNLNHVDFDKFIDEPVTTNNLLTPQLA